VKAAPLVVALGAVALAGCPSVPSPGDVFLSRQARSVALVLDEAGRPQGVAVVVRATPERVFLALGRPAPGLPPRPLVAIGDRRVPARVHESGALTLLEVPRADRDLRPVVPAGEPDRGEGTVLLTALGGPWVDLWEADIAEVGGDRLRLEDAPQAAPEEAPALSGWAAAMIGAAVFSRAGALHGFVRSVDPDGRPVVVRAARLLPLLRELFASDRGSDVVTADDARYHFALRVDDVGGLPTLEDEWGAPDYFVVLEVGGVRLDPIEVSPGRVDRDEWLVEVPAPGPVIARLVERDVTLGEGEREEDLAEPTTFEALENPLVVRFTLLPEVAAAAADERVPSPGIVLGVRPVHPDRESDDDRTPFGASAVAVNRVISGTLDLDAGDATDFWAVDVTVPGPSLILLLQREPHSRLSAEAFEPSFAERLARVETHATRRLTVARGGDLPRGRVVLRVRERRGGPGPTHYGVMLVPQGDAHGLVRRLFRMIAREATGSPAFDSRQFATEVAVALAFDAGLEPADASEAVLAQLGHRTAIVRHLVLRLLEVHFPPSLPKLEQVWAQSQLAQPGRGDLARPDADRPSRALDAGLLLALRQPDDPRYVPVVHRTAQDPDPLIRLRGLAVASRFTDPELRATLRALFEDDPSAIVRRAYHRS